LKDGTVINKKIFMHAMLLFLAAVTITAYMPGGGEFLKDNPAGIFFGI
jgi:hypothetical protein